MSRVASGSVRRTGERLTLVDVEPGVCAIGQWQNVMLVIWWSAAVPAAVERIEQEMIALAHRFPEKNSQIHLVKDRAGVPGPEARAGLIRLMTDYTTSLANCAVVIGGTGFWASTMRSAITSMRFLSTRAFEMRLHGSTAEILDWLPEAHLRQTGVEITRDDLSRILRDAEEWLLGGFDAMRMFS